MRRTVSKETVVLHQFWTRNEYLVLSTEFVREFGCRKEILELTFHRLALRHFAWTKG